MSELSNAPAGGAEQPVAAPIVSTPADTRTTLTPSEAGRALAQRRFEKQREQQAAPEPVPQEPVPVEQPELAETPDDAQPEADPVEATEQQPEPAEPPIEPPRSWTKEAKERWQSLPRETQEYLATREQERDREVRRSQNEAAEKLKGLTAKEQQAEQVRQQYEQQLPALLQQLQAAQAGQFADIKTQEDVNKLAAEDWPRFAQWQAHQMQVESAQRAMQQAHERQANEFKTKWSTFANEQDQKLIERAPELADKSKATKIAESAKAVLTDVGFTDQELAQLWNGEASVSLRDHRVQLLILDGVKYRDAKAAKPQPKPLPPVQRSGVAPARSNAPELQTLSKKLESSGRIEDAVALRQARRAAAAR